MSTGKRSAPAESSRIADHDGAHRRPRTRSGVRLTIAVSTSQLVDVLSQRGFARAQSHLRPAAAWIWLERAGTVTRIPVCEVLTSEELARVLEETGLTLGDLAGALHRK